MQWNRLGFFEYFVAVRSLSIMIVSYVQERDVLLSLCLDL